MHVLEVNDVNEALPRGMMYLRDNGCTAPSRNGPVLVAPGPVATVYRDPIARVLFDPRRDINPFFHLFEALWIIAGRKDVAFLKVFNSKMADYSDNGVDFHAAYGYRLRRPMDQISAAIEMLQQDPSSRRVVLQIWDYSLDLNTKSKDLPCNDLIFLRVNGGNLDITVANRSNDVIWGAYGTNAVQFSVIQEYIAAHLGLKMGAYTQISNNYHAYTELPYWQEWYHASKNGGAGFGFGDGNPYRTSFLKGGVAPTYLFLDSPVVSEKDTKNMFSAFDSSNVSGGKNFEWVDEIQEQGGFSSFAFTTVVMPLLKAWAMHKSGKTVEAYEYLRTTQNQVYDWVFCATQWLKRRVEKKNAA